MHSNYPPQYHNNRSPQTSIDWVSELDLLARSVRENLLQDREFINNAFDFEEPSCSSLPVDVLLDTLFNETLRTLCMVRPFIRPRMRILEIGGGVGLFYSLLRAKGADIVSLEPGSEGFGDRHRAGMQLLELLHVDPVGWVRSGIEEYKSAKGFDLVFSHFALEHILHLDRAFDAMSGLLNPRGLMIHRCPNYNIPFEPHFNIPLVPFRPRWTAFFMPSLRKSGLWKGLQFTTAGKILELCYRNGLTVTFKRGMTAWAFDQLFIDKAFAFRKKGLVSAAKLLRSTGLLDLIRHLPARLDTPIEFVASKTEK